MEPKEQNQPKVQPIICSCSEKERQELGKMRLKEKTYREEKD